jgi:hypothetical protein
MIAKVPGALWTIPFTMIMARQRLKARTARWRVHSAAFRSRITGTAPVDLHRIPDAMPLRN